MSKCPDIMDLESALQLPEGNPIRQHVQHCGQCQALLLSLTTFEHEGPLPGDENVPGLQPEEIARTDEHLNHFLSEKIGASEPSKSVHFPRKKSRTMPMTWVGMAAALVAIVGLWAVPNLHDAGTSREILRGEEGLHANNLELISSSRNASGGLDLTWQVVEGADSYEVVFWSDGLEEYSRLESVAETTVSIAAVLLPDAQKAIYFNILAMSGDREITRSSLMEIPAHQ